MCWLGSSDATCAFATMPQMTLFGKPAATPPPAQPKALAKAPAKSKRLSKQLQKMLEESMEEVMEMAVNDTSEPTKIEPGVEPDGEHAPASNSVVAGASGPSSSGLASGENVDDGSAADGPPTSSGAAGSAGDDGAEEAAHAGEANAAPTKDGGPPRKRWKQALAQADTEGGNAAVVATAESSKGTLTFEEVALAPRAPYCTKCGYDVDPCSPGVRLTSKNPPSWKCNRCNSKHVALCRAFGRWPIDEFLELSADEQQKFWQESDTGAKGVKGLVEKYIAEKHVSVELARLEGPYLPLSVWQQQGYDVSLIEKSAAREEHPILGTVYQVKIKTTGMEKRKELIREHMSRLLQKAMDIKASKDMPMDTNNKDEPIDVKRDTPKANVKRDVPKAASKKNGVVEEDSDGSEDEASTIDDSDSSSESSSESSDSSSEKKKSKKHRKNNKKASKKSNKKGSKKTSKKKSKRGSKKESKKEAKERQKEEARQREAAKEEKKRVGKIRSDASRAVAKLGGLIQQIEDLMNHPATKRTPKFAVAKLQEAYKHAKTMNDEARDKLKESSPHPLSFTINEVSEMHKAALEAWKLAKQYVETAKKHA